MTRGLENFGAGFVTFLPHTDRTQHYFLLFCVYYPPKASVYIAIFIYGRFSHESYKRAYFFKDAFRNELRRVLNRGEAVNALKRAIYTGRISPAQAKRVDEMQAVADALSLMANIVMAWNTSQMQAVLDRWSNRRQVIPSELIGKIAPTRLESINLRGVFRFPVDRYADQILPSRLNAPITGTNG